MNPLLNPLSRRPAKPVEALQLEPSLRSRLEALVEAISICSPSSFQFAGGAPIEVAGAGSPPGSPHLVEAMLPLVYSQGYAQHFKGSGPPPTEVRPQEVPGLDAAFVAQLSAAHRGQNSWDPQWRVYQLGQNGAVHVQKGDVFRLALPGEYVLDGGPGWVARVGDAVELRVVRESQVMQPHFYFVFGETVPSDFDDANLSRLYFHARPDSMPRLLALVTEALNRYHVPFRFKCLNHPGAYVRSDAAVLYVARRFVAVTLRLLADARDELAGWLNSDVPLFTKALGPGLGVADDPGGHESFGQSRCRLLCQGLVDAWAAGWRTPSARLQAVANRFASMGLELERPYLSEGTADPYEWPFARRAQA